MPTTANNCENLNAACVVVATAREKGIWWPGFSTEQRDWESVEKNRLLPHTQRQWQWIKFIVTDVDGNLLPFNCNALSYLLLRLQDKEFTGSHHRCQSLKAQLS